MHVLPKANPLNVRIPARTIVIPDAFEKLVAGNFTGYLNHSSPEFEASCIFSSGKLICVSCTENGIDTTGLKAITRMFDKILGAGGEINVYRMTSDLAMCSHALLQGTNIYTSDDVRQVDIKGMLSQFKSAELNGAVLFSTSERHAMIFFKSGQPIGFYHDGATAIESSPDESRKVAALPGARMDVYATKPLEKLIRYDLLSMINLRGEWEAAVARFAESGGRTEDSQQIDKGNEQLQNKLTELVEDLQEVAMAYLSREGRLIIQNRLQEAGGSTILSNAEKRDVFLQNVAEDALQVDTQDHVEEMVNLMKSEITGRLAL
jgi:TATA-box binding protein (TBP) (component of TFIID and TFIIIB)